MTIFGVVADVHGNLEALRAALECLERRGVDRILCLGDLVGYGADPDACVELLRRREALAIAGNHDLIAIGRLGFERCANKVAFALRRTRRAIGPDAMRYLAMLPTRRTVGEEILMTHGGFDNVERYVVGADDVAREAAAVQQAFPRVRLCLFGHTHEPRFFEIAPDAVVRHEVTRAPLERGRLYYVNPGSVDGSRKRVPGTAECVVLDTGRDIVEFHRVPYDHDAAEFKAAGLGYRIPRLRAAATRLQRRAVASLRKRGSRRRPADTTRTATPNADPIRVEWLTRPDEIDALEPEWKALGTAATGRLVFATADFVLPWYRAYWGEPGHPLVASVRSRGELVAVAPFVQWRDGMGRRLVRRIDLAGFDGDGGQCLVADPHPEAAAAVLGSLAASSFDVVRFDHLTPGSAIEAAIRRRAHELHLRVVEENSPGGTALLSAGYEDYLRGKGPEFAAQVERQATRMRAAGARVHAVHPGDDPAGIARLLERLLGVVDAGLEARGRRMRELHRHYFRALLDRFGASGSVDLAVLEAGGRDLAGQVSVVDRGVAHSIMTAVRDDSDGLPASAYLMQEVFRALSVAGVSAYVSNGPRERTRAWETAACPRHRLAVGAGSLRSRLVLGAARLPGVLRSRGLGA